MEYPNWWLCLIILILAAFRLTLLISADDGPFGMFRKLRSFLKREAKTNKIVKATEVDKGIQCIRCSGYWIGLLLAAFAFLHSSLPLPAIFVGDFIILASALSGAVILLIRAFPAR